MDKSPLPAGETGELKPAPKPAQPAAKKVRKPEASQASNKSFTQRVAHWVTEYVLSLRYEWQKITFPTRKEWVQATIVVFLFTLILMAVISVYDAGMSLFFSKFILPVSRTATK